MEEVAVEKKKPIHIQPNQPSSVISQLGSSVKKQQQSSSPESNEAVIGGSNVPVLVPLQVPKAFKYPERYRSPTDAMVSPITRGIMGRRRRGGGEGAARLAPLMPPISTSLSSQKVVTD